MYWIEVAITVPPNKQMVLFDVPKKKNPLLSKQDIVGGKTGYWKPAIGEGFTYEQAVGTATVPARILYYVKQ